MRGRISLIAAAATIALFPLPLAGQDIAPPAPRGSRVRVTMQVPAGLEYVGTLESWDAESLSLGRPGGPPGRLELSEMAKLELSCGMKGWRGTGGPGPLIGLGMGGGGGMVAGLVVGLANDDPEAALGIAL